MPPNGLPIPTTTDEQAVLFVAVFESSTIIRVHDKRVNFTRRLTPEEVIANIRILSQNGKARVH